MVIENRKKKMLPAVTKCGSSLFSVCELSFEKKLRDGICKVAYI